MVEILEAKMMYLCTCKYCGLWFTSDKPTDCCGGASLFPQEECKEKPKNTHPHS